MPLHYRCYRVYITVASAKQTSDTLKIFPAQLPMPATSSAVSAMESARSQVQALQHPAPAAPFETFGDDQQNALHQLSKIFNTAASYNPYQNQPPQTNEQTDPPVSVKTPVPTAPVRQSLRLNPPEAPRVAPPAALRVIQQTDNSYNGQQMNKPNPNNQ